MSNKEEKRTHEEGMGINLGELSLFKAMRKQLVEIDFNAARRVLEISIKDSKSSLAGSISLFLSKNLMVYPLEAVDAIITAYWLNEVSLICKGEYKWRNTE